MLNPTNAKQQHRAETIIAQLDHYLRALADHEPGHQSRLEIARGFLVLSLTYALEEAKQS